MGAILAGLLGAAGEDIKQKELMRRADEIRKQQLRLDVLKAAASSPNLRPEALPEIFGQMDEIAGEMPGSGRGRGKKQKQPGKFSMMGQMLGGLLGHGQGQVPGGSGVPTTPPFLPPGTAAAGSPAPAAASPSPAAVAAVPGQDVAAAVGAGAAAPAAQLPPMPRSRFYTQPELEAMETRASERKTAQELARFRGERKVEAEMSDQEFQAKMERVGKLEKGLGIPREEAVATIFGTRGVSKPIMVRGAKSDQYPELGIGPGKVGVALIDPMTHKALDFIETAAGAAGGSKTYQVTQGGHRRIYDASGKLIADLGRVDEPLSWKPIQKGNEVWYEPFSPRTHAPLGPAVPNIPEERSTTAGGALGKTPAAGAGAGSVSTKPSGGSSIPELPSTRLKGAETQVTRPAGVSKGARYGGEKFSARQKEMMERSETVMRTGVEAIQLLQTLPQQHADWFGPIAGRVTEVKNKIGFAPPGVRDLIAKIHSVQNFLPSLHGLRGKYPLEAWEQVLRDPFVNPAATADAIKGALNAAEEYRKVIQRGDLSGEVTVKGLTREMAPPATRQNPYRTGAAAQ